MGRDTDAQEAAITGAVVEAVVEAVAEIAANQPHKIDTWDFAYLRHEYVALLKMQALALNTIECLQHHEKEIKSMVSWLHKNMPERFDLSGRQTMADIMTGIGRDYIELRDRSLWTWWSRWGRWWRKKKQREQVKEEEK